MLECGRFLIFRGVNLRDGILSGLSLLVGEDEGLLKLLGFPVLFSESLKLAASFIGNAGISDVSTSDLLVKSASLVVLSAALSTGLLSLVQIKLLELSVHRDVYLDLFIMLHVFQFVFNQLFLDGSKLVNVLLSVIVVQVLGLFLLELHLRLQFVSHLLTLASESTHLLTLLSGPVVVVSVDGGSPLGIGHADDFALHAGTDLVHRVHHHLAAGNALGTTHSGLGLGNVGLHIIVYVHGSSRLSALATGVLDGDTNHSVDFIQLTLTDGRLLHNNAVHLLGNAAVKLSFGLNIHVVLIAELVNEEFRKLLTGGLLVRRTFS